MIWGASTEEQSNQCIAGIPFVFVCVSYVIRCAPLRKPTGLLIEFNAQFSALLEISVWVTY